MKRRFRIRVIDAMALLAIVGYVGFKVAARPRVHGVERSSFAKQVKLDPFNSTAVQADGRLRSFESHAKTYMGYIAGPRAIKGQSNGFTYLDLIFRPQRYIDADIIYVKKKQIRKRILDTLEGHPDVDEARADKISSSGLISRGLLNEPGVLRLLGRLNQDLIRTSKSVSAIESALAVSDTRFLEDNLRMVAPPGGARNLPWVSAARLAGTTGAPQDDVHADSTDADHAPGVDRDLQSSIAAAWSGLGDAWAEEDSAAVNTRIEKLARLLPLVAPQLYPSSGRLGMESWYFRNKSMTWVWLLYLAAVVPLLMSVIYKWRRARTIGMVVFTVAFLAHTTSLGIRWYISGRWPNANMFEALTTSAWLGGVAAMILERLSRRTPFRNLFALASGVMSMAALMAAYFLPAQLDSGINNKMAALNDVWLYIHTNVIIWSYAIIGLACIPAFLMLRHRWCLLWDQALISKTRLLVLPVALGVLNYTSYRLLMHLVANPTYGLSGPTLLGMTGGFWGSLMIIAMEWLSARRRTARGVKVERASAGGATSLIVGSSPTSGFLRSEQPSASQVFDGATMVLVELSFIMLWTGIVMGAIWADHSWGRPWGWDPKEVFALNTFIIFLILIHVRLKVRDKGLWTAVIAIAGFEVMMFNWIVVNFIITGLHSYA